MAYVRTKNGHWLDKEKSEKVIDKFEEGALKFTSAFIGNVDEIDDEDLSGDDDE